MPNLNQNILPIRFEHLFLGYFDADGTKYYNADGSGVADVTWDKTDSAVILYAHWSTSLHFELGNAVNEVALGSYWSPANMANCKYSIDGREFKSMTSKTISLGSNTNNVYFAGDCRNSNNILYYMFGETFKDNYDVRLSGQVIGIMGGEPINETAGCRFPVTFAANQLTSISENLFSGIVGPPANLMFENTFYDNQLTSIPANLFSGIEGAPADSMFQNTFTNNQLTSIPANLFSGIEGAPADYMFQNTFQDNTKLSSIGDLGMNITGSTSDYLVYLNMFQNVGTDPSVQEITLPEGGPIALFTNSPSADLDTLGELYTGGYNNKAFAGTGWYKYSGYADIPANWK
jgi:hypothetical protein